MIHRIRILTTVFGISSVFAIAPVDGQISRDTSIPLSGLALSNLTLTDSAYSLIGGSHDGDVGSFDGLRTYDRASPVDRVATALKTLRFVHGANHKQFNTVWDGTLPDHPPTADGTDVRDLTRINLTAYAFATLNRWEPYRAFLKREVTFPSVPTGMTVVRQYQDPLRVFFNHYEEDDEVESASLLDARNIVTGSISRHENKDFFSPRPPDWLWNQTDGALIEWSGDTDGVMEIQVPPGNADLLTDYPVLAFRIGQVFDESGTLNPDGVNKDLTVRLVVDGNSGPTARVGDYVALVSGVDVPGTRFERQLGLRVTKTMMSSVRIPWTHLIGEELENFSGEWQLRFELDQHSEGLIVMDEIQASQ